MTLEDSKPEFVSTNRYRYPESILAILACPHCLSTLESKPNGMFCYACDVLYHYSDTGALDLRLQNTKRYQIECVLESELVPEGLEVVSLAKNPSPQVDFSQFHVPFHMSSELMSYFPSPQEKGALMLDLGCGDTVHRGICEHAGFEYVGLDYFAREAPLIGDGHSLPFKDEVFEFVLSMAVLEHIRFPFVMASEVFRVLKPGGLFVGSVAFLEPFHGDSFYHHTHLGLINTLRSAGFYLEKIAPTDNWPVLIAQANMGLFPKMPPTISRAVVMPLQMVHKAWWKAARSVKKGKGSEVDRLRNLAGSFTFIARKEH